MSTLILLLMMAGQEPMYITDHPELPLLSFVINDEAIVTIMPDGSVTYGKGFNADSAAKKFYESYGNLLRAQGRYTQQDVIAAYRFGQAEPKMAARKSFPVAPCSKPASPFAGDMVFIPGCPIELWDGNRWRLLDLQLPKSTYPIGWVGIACEVDPSATCPTVKWDGKKWVKQQ